VRTIVIGGLTKVLTNSMFIDYSPLKRNSGMRVDLPGSRKQAILIDLTAKMDRVIYFVDLNPLKEKRHGHGPTAHKIQRG
jgi:hypothetical protein